jgi:hypothetical protein
MLDVFALALRSPMFDRGPQEKTAQFGDGLNQDMLSVRSPPRNPG